MGIIYVANPVSRQSIRNYTIAVREMFDMKNEEYFPIVEFLELGLPFLNSSFELEIVPVQEMRNEYGITYPERNQIVLREDVYENAISGVARDRFTVAHEIGHFLMHKPGSLSLARNTQKISIPSYRDPEWQANTFAGELLAPPHIIDGLSPNEIALRCGVSVAVGKIQMKKS